MCIRDSTNLLGNAWKYTAKIDRARIAFGAGTDEDGRVVYLSLIHI